MLPLQVDLLQLPPGEPTLLSPSLTMSCDFFYFVLLLSGCDESSFPTCPDLHSNSVHSSCWDAPNCHGHHQTSSPRHHHLHLIFFCPMYFLICPMGHFYSDLNPPVMEGLDALLAVMHYYVLTVFLYRICALSQCLVVNMMATAFRNLSIW